MTTDITTTEQNLRQAFKYINRFMLFMWRLGLGPWVNFWPPVVGRIMVITHTGRKSGLRRRSPVNYTLIDNEIYCTAAYGSAADWYRNILHNPQIEVWLPDGWWAGEAEDISDTQDRLAILRQILFASGFAGRLAGIDPVNISDEELDAITTKYRLIHIKRRAACTGPGGPGDLAWVWPLATMILLPLALRRRRRR
jgi:deazaflavin-dependent oxidoreductase (nitroreductase family)